VVEACSWRSIICWLAAKHTIADGWAKDGAPPPSWRATWDGIVGLLWCADQLDVVMARERSEDNRSNTCHPIVVASVTTSNGGFHTWEGSSTCRAPAATSVIALVAAFYGGSHDLSLRASRWGQPLGKMLNGKGIKNLVSVIPGKK
jgi:hypothetical protein